MKKRTILFTAIAPGVVAAALVLRPPSVVSLTGGWEPRVCRYEHVETTGLMDRVTLPDGGSALVRFTSDSDPVAMAGLAHLGNHLIFGTSDDGGQDPPFRQKITLHGAMARKKSPGFPEGDDFHWFRLQRWTLEVPFDIRIFDRADFDALPAVRSCSTFAEAGVGDPKLDGKTIPMESFLVRQSE